MKHDAVSMFKRNKTKNSFIKKKENALRENHICPN